MLCAEEQTDRDQLIQEPGHTEDAYGNISLLAYLSGQQNFFCKGQVINILGFSGYKISVQLLNSVIVV